jgi:hypothetical protein
MPYFVMSISPIDCNIYLPPLQDGYKIVNSAWTLVYIAGKARDGMHHPSPPELVYRWNPSLFAEVRPMHSSGGRSRALKRSNWRPDLWVWAMPATDHLWMPSSPAMVERLCSPSTGRSFQAYVPRLPSVRVNQTARLLHRLLGAHGLLPASPPPACLLPAFFRRRHKLHGDKTGSGPRLDG